MKRCCDTVLLSGSGGIGGIVSLIFNRAQRYFASLRYSPSVRHSPPDIA